MASAQHDLVDRIIWLCLLALLVPATRVTLARDVTRNLPEARNRQLCQNAT